MIIGVSGKIQSGKDTIAKIINAYGVISYAIESKLISKNPSKEDEYRFVREHILNPYIFPGSRWRIMRFAAVLKQLVAVLTFCNVEELENEEFKNTPLPENWNKYRLLDFHKVLPTTFATHKEAEEFCRKNSNSQHVYTYKEEVMTRRKLLQLLGTEFGRDMIHPNIWVNTLFAQYDPLNHNWVVPDTRFLNEAQAIIENRGFIIRVERKASPIFNHPSETELDYFSKFKYTIDNNGSIDDLITDVKHILYQEGYLPGGLLVNIDWLPQVPISNS